MKPVVALTAVLAAGCAMQATDGADGARPNVVLVMCDDLGWGDVGFNGNAIIRTPHLDAMARASLRLQRFYAAAPVCSPTRGSVVTGRHPSRYGIPEANRGHLPAEEVTLYELLAARGYTTGHFGKWHMGTLTRTVRESNRGGARGAAHYSPPWEHGVDVTFATEAKTPTFDPMVRPPGAPSWGWSPVTAGAPAEAYGTHYWTGPGQMVDPASPELRGDDSAILMGRALEFIAGAAAAKTPFLAVIWLHAPHLPVVAGPEHTRLYPGVSDYEANYYGCITALDEQVGRLRARLRELAVADDTIVAFCSDNGPEGVAGRAPGSAGPLRGRKRDLYEGGIRVPSLLEWPARIRGGRSTSVPCGTVDYLPTILEAVGIPVPAGRPLDGISILPLADGARDFRPAPLGFQSGRQVALIGDRYKLLSSDAGASWSLFDLLADVGESVDLAAQRPDLHQQMIAIVSRWRASCAASAAGVDYRAAPLQAAGAAHGAGAR